MSNFCEPILAALKDCILHSDCVVKNGNLPSDCLKNHVNELPEQCQSLRLAAFECKRGMLDMRKRFRGNNAASYASPSATHEPGGASSTSPAVSSQDS